MTSEVVVDGELPTRCEVGEKLDHIGKLRGLRPQYYMKPVFEFVDDGNPSLGANLDRED